jgi:toxin YhaV
VLQRSRGARARPAPPSERARDAATGREPRGTPLIINGWRIYLYAPVAERYAAVIAEVERLRSADPQNYRSTPAAKFARVLHDVMTRQIPSDPAAPLYRLGNTLGPGAKTWRRAKFLGRFRLFFRYSSEQRTIVYAWLNDETTFRKAGASTNVYAIFRQLLERGTPPADWGALMNAVQSTPAANPLAKASAAAER